MVRVLLRLLLLPPLTEAFGCISPVMSEDSEVKQTVKIERTCSVYRQGKSAL